MEYKTTVIEVLQRTEHAVSVRFERPAGFSYLPGQYMFITLGSGENTLTKHLTLSSSPTEPLLEVTKGMTGHPFANALAALDIGTSVAIRGPYGEFTFTGEFEQVVFISGGIGVTPMRSMMRYATDKGLLNRIKLLYSARNEEDVLFGTEMKNMQNNNPLLSVKVTLTRPGPEWKGKIGRIDRAFIELEVQDWKDQVFFISGPLVMVDSVVAIIREIGVPEGHIRQEYFSGY
jgi:ferredoxin-NADP reductase